MVTYPNTNVFSDMLNPYSAEFLKLTSYCRLKLLWSGMGEVVPARTSPTLHPPSPPTVHQLSRLALKELTQAEFSTLVLPALCSKVIQTGLHILVVIVYLFLVECSLRSQGFERGTQAGQLVATLLTV